MATSPHDVKEIQEIDHHEITEDHKDPLDIAKAPVLKSSFDELTPWETAKTFKKAVFVCFMLCVAAAADGYQINLNGNIIANPGFVQQVGYLDPATGKYALNPQHTALWGALQSLGQLIGMVLLNPISDKIGRKMTLYVLWVILLGSILIETFTKNFQHWAGAKLLAGVGIGSLQATLPIYIAEWSPVNIRGTLCGTTVMYAVVNNVGSFLAPLVLTVVKGKDVNEWKIPVLTQWAFLGIMLPIFWWLPETASYYAARDQHDRGIAVLRRVNGGVPGYDPEAEYEVVKNIILEERERQAAAGVDYQNWRQILRSYGECFQGCNWKRTIAASLPASIQQLTGLAFLSVYSSLFFRELGFTDAFEITSIIFGVKIGAVLVVCLTTDKLGRRIPIISFGVVCLLMLLIIGILGHVEKNQATKIVLILAVCVWSCTSVGLGALGWALPGEVPNQKLRARTSGLGSAIAVCFGLTFNTATPIMLQTNGANLGYDTAWIFLGFGTLVTILAVFLLPETAQRNPAELDEMYENGVPAWRMKKYVTEVQKAQAARRGQTIQ
ncbi:sugar transporter [Kwoniella heveanensis BCC8398]|uniref:Sugar transporter n=1 Tax=Kwoniella heveanensis BCC8398 TaxID=1296120 RepID=A0A1B9GXU6_9TREE|nr:sugar transporter [Kwoniella heveanensis BCC8398]